MKHGPGTDTPPGRDDGLLPPEPELRAGWRTPHPLLLSFRSNRWRWPWAILTTLTALALMAGMMAASTFLVPENSDWTETQSILRLGVASDYWLILEIWGGLATAALLALRVVKGDRIALAFTATGTFHISDFAKAALAILITFTAASLVTYAMTPADFMRPERTPAFWGWLAFGLFVILIQSAAEETFFRGVLFRVWGAVIPYAWLASALIMSVFIALHVPNGDVQRDLAMGLITFVIGEALAYYALVRTKCLAAPIGLHWANNIFQFFLVATRPPNSTDTAIFVYTDPVYSAGGSRLLDPASHVMTIAGIVLVLTLLFWQRSPLYLPKRELST